MLERLNDCRWRRRRGLVVNTYTFEDIDGSLIARLEEGAFMDQRERQRRVPQLIGVRDADVFWWFRDSLYRSNRALPWSDVESLVGAGAVDRPPMGGRSEPSVRTPARLLHMPSTPRSVVRHLRANGGRGTRQKVVQRLRPHLYLTEAHIWTALTLPSPKKSHLLPDGLEFRRGGYADVGTLASLPTPVSKNAAERRLAEGAALWLVKDASRTVFCAWTFTEFAPAIAAPGGRLRVPPAHVVLDDTATAGPYRGRGIAPAAWLEIAERFERSGHRRMLAKIKPQNRTSRRAFAKAGFTEAAIVDLQRIAARNRVYVSDLRDAEIAQMLRERLAGC